MCMRGSGYLSADQRETIITEFAESFDKSVSEPTRVEIFNALTTYVELKSATVAAKGAGKLAQQTFTEAQNAADQAQDKANEAHRAFAIGTCCSASYLFVACCLFAVCCLLLLVSYLSRVAAYLLVGQLLIIIIIITCIYLFCLRIRRNCTESQGSRDQDGLWSPRGNQKGIITKRFIFLLLLLTCT